MQNNKTLCHTALDYIFSTILKEAGHNTKNYASRPKFSLSVEREDKFFIILYNYHVKTEFNDCLMNSTNLLQISRV